MQYKIFRIPLDDPGQQEEELNAFLRNHKVVSVQSQLVDGTNPAYAFLVEYVQGDGKAQGKRPRLDYREILPPDQFAVYARLREARKALAKEHGMPIYAVFSNEQLADMARKPPGTLEELAAIKGVGAGKMEKFGSTIMETLKGADRNDADRNPL